MTKNTNKTNKGGLGKGLSALISDIQEEVDLLAPSSFAQTSAITDTSSNELSIHLLEPGPYQPRHYFNQDSLKELADSIRERGVIQPIIVTTMRETGKHQIIAGERRWRAAKMAGLPSIPAIIKDVNEQQAYELALIENIQRNDLSVIEEAEGYKRLIDQFDYTQEKLSEILGKSRSHIANLLRLLSLPVSIKELLAEGKLTMGHARALLAAKNPIALAEQVVQRGLNVRQTEALVKFENDPAAEHRPASPPYPSRHLRRPTDPARDNDIVQLEEMLSEKLGLVVNIFDHEVGSGGTVEIQFHSLEDLDKILQRLSGVAQ